jgi:hypothetical protein
LASHALKIKKSNATLFYPLLWPAPLDCRGVKTTAVSPSRLRVRINEYKIVLLTLLLLLTNIPHNSEWKRFLKSTTRCRQNAVQRETMVVFKSVKRWQRKLRSTKIYVI